MLLRSLPANPTDGGMATALTLESLEASILALSPRGWFDFSNPVYRVDSAGKCAQATDRSGNGFHLLQATGANQPPVSANYWGSLNGVARDAIAFDGTTTIWMETAGNLFNGTTLWSFFCIQRPMGTAQSTIFSTSNGSSVFSEVQLSSTQMVFPGGGTGATVNPPAMQAKQVAIGTYNYPGSGNVTTTLDINGVSGSLSFALGSTAPGTSHLIIGVFGTGHSLKFNGLVSEIIMVPGVFDANAIALLKQYAGFKYA